MSAPKPSSRDKVRAHRERMRALGFRQVTRWVLDTRSPEARAHLRDEARAIALADSKSPDARAVDAWLAQNFDDLCRELDAAEEAQELGRAGLMA